MSQAVLIPPAVNLVRQVASYLEAEGKDYSAYIVIFPGKRPSHFLRKVLGESEKGSFIPPRIFSMDEFVDFIYGEKLGINKKTLEVIDAVAFLFDIQLNAAGRLGGKDFITPDTFLPVGIKLYRDIEECHIEKVDQRTIRTMDTLAGEKIPGQTLQGLKLFSYFYEQFYKRIEAGGYATRAVRYRTAAEKIDEADVTAVKKIILAGFFALTSAEKDLFRRLNEKENTLFIFQQGTGIKKKLKEMGLEADVLPEAEPCGRTGDTKTAGPLIKFYKSPDTHGQVFALSRIIKECLEKGQSLDERDVVVLPASESLFALMAHALPLLEVQNIPYNISMGYPIHRTPIFGFLNSLMELITSMDNDRVYVPDYFKFVLHPYTKNIFFEKRTDITRIIFHVLEEELSKKRSRGFIRLSDIENDLKLLEQVMKRLAETQAGTGIQQVRGHIKDIHQQTIARFRSFENTGDFARKVIEVLTYIHQNSTARLHPFFTPFLEVFLQSVHLMATSALREVKFTGPAGYFHLMRRYIMTCRVPFEGTPLKGLQVLGFLETRNLSFEQVFIFDVNEEVLPNTQREDTLLPYKARKEMGLPVYRDREELINYYLELLINGARSVHLFFVEKDKRTRSRFVERLLWQKQKEDNQITDKKYIKSVQYHVKLESKGPEPLSKTPEVMAYLREHRYSSTSLDTYLRCPLQFYYRYVLGLEEKKDMSGDIERADIGSLVHRILKKYFENKKGRPLSPAQLSLEEMDETVDVCIKDDYGENLSGSAYLLGRQVKKRMKEFIQAYQIPLVNKEPVSVIEVEHEINLNKDSFNLTGKIDRIERRGLRIFIVDYKISGNSNYLKVRWDKLDFKDRQTWPRAVKTLQLAFYLLLYSQAAGIKIEELTSIFLLLGKVVLGPGRTIELPLFEQTQADYIKSHFNLLQDIIFELLNEITDRQYPFKPTASKKDHCPVCVFSRICDTQWTKK